MTRQCATAVHDSTMFMHLQLTAGAGRLVHECTSRLHDDCDWCPSIPIPVPENALACFHKFSSSSALQNSCIQSFVHTTVAACAELGCGSGRYSLGRKVDCRLGLLEAACGGSVSSLSQLLTLPAVAVGAY